MAPTHSKPLPEQPLLGTCKRILASSLADPNNVDAAAIKRHKLEEAAAVRRLCQPSIEIVEDDEDDPTVLMHPRKASNILEASDGSDDEPSEFGRGGSSVRDGSMPGLTDEEEEEEEEEEEGEDVDGGEEAKDDSDDEYIELSKRHYS